MPLSGDVCAVDGAVCWPGWDIYGRDLVRAPFFGSKAINAMDCFARCKMVSTCTFSVYVGDTNIRTSTSGTCYLKSTALSCSGSNCAGTTGGRWYLAL